MGRPLLIAIQMTCLVAGPLVVVMLITGDDRLRFGGILVFVAALAGVYSSQWLAMPSQRPTCKTLFQLAQLLLLLLVVRVLTWGIFGGWPNLESLRQWVLEPSTFFDLPYVAIALMAALAWHRAGVVAGLFYRLALTAGELSWIQEQSAGSWWRSGRPSERGQVSRQEMVDDYGTQWLLGGFFVIFFAGAARVRTVATGGLDLFNTGVPDQLVVAAVLYFLTGLVLLSQARLAQMRAQWYFDGVEVPDSLSGRWNRLAVALVAGVGLVAALLPLGSTWQLGEIVSIIVGVIVQIAVSIVALLVALFSSIMLLFGGPTEMPPTPPPLVGEPAPPPPPLFPVLEMPPWLGGAGLWLAVAVIAILAVRFLLGPDGLAVTRERVRFLLARLAGLLRRWWRGLKQVARTVDLSLPLRRGGREGDDASQARPWRFIRVNALPPRERVRYFYLSIVRRATDLGMQRKPSQTPDEYLRDLELALPEAELELEALTHAFIAARYDTADFTPDEAQAVKSTWQRIKQALRGSGVARDRKAP